VDVSGSDWYRDGDFSLPEVTSIGAGQSEKLKKDAGTTEAEKRWSLQDLQLDVERLRIDYRLRELSVRQRPGQNPIGGPDHSRNRLKLVQQQNLGHCRVRCGAKSSDFVPLSLPIPSGSHV
jgi:hypothetical protein